MSDLVPEDAIAAVARALCTDHGHARQVGGMDCRTCLRRARVAAEAAAPLIRAAELDRLVGFLPRSKAARYCEPRVMDVLAEELRARASVLRGEGEPK